LGHGWLDLVEFLEQLTGIELSIVCCPQTLNGCVPLVLAQQKSSATSLVQSMVFFWISIIWNSSAEIT
jgi:hypothetical protein